MHTLAHARLCNPCARLYIVVTDTTCIMLFLFIPFHAANGNGDDADDADDNNDDDHDDDADDGDQGKKRV